MTTEILPYTDAETVAEAIAVRLSTRLYDLQRADSGRTVEIALTGGRIATRAYEQLAAAGADAGVDWGRVGLWWGDERFVAADSADRNDGGALRALRPALPLAEENVHPMPAADAGLSLDDAAAAYGRELGGTRFDICLLGVGPDGHVASLFPEHPSSTAGGEVIAVRDSPKPPPERISLTHRVLNRSAEVWFTVAGEDKAAAVAAALQGADLPAARARGTERTVWFLDQAAAAQLPSNRG